MLDCRTCPHSPNHVDIFPFRPAPSVYGVTVRPSAVRLAREARQTSWRPYTSPNLCPLSFGESRDPTQIEGRWGTREEEDRGGRGPEEEEGIGFDRDRK